MVLAFSEAKHDKPDYTLILGDPRKIEFSPLDLYEVQDVLARNFGQNVISGALARTLWQYGEGHAPKISNGVRGLVEKDLLRLSGDRWCVDEGASAAALAEPFEAVFFARLNTRLTQLEPDDADRIHSFLERAALCGQVVPVALILAQMGLSENERGDFVDHLDEVFEPETPDSIFDDFEFQHPSFPDILTYGFSNPIWPAIILKHVSAADRSRLALEIAAFLDPRLPVRTRGVARLLYQFAQHMDAQEDAEYYAAEMRWWTGSADADLLRDLLVSGLQNGSLAADALWQELQRLHSRWPPYRSFAVLEAYAQRKDGIPVALLGAYWHLRSVLLIQLGWFEKSLSSAQTGLGFVSDDLRLQAGLQLRIGFASEQLTLLGDARRAFEESIQFYESLSAETGISTAHFGLGQVDHAEGRYNDARERFLRSLEIDERVLGPDHTSVASTLHALARVDHAEGRYDDARKRFLRSLEIRERVLGPDHPSTTGTYFEVAESLVVLGEIEQAEELAAKAVASRESRFGSDHIRTAYAVPALARVRRAQRDYSEARKLFQRAIRIRRANLPQDHPETLALESELGELPSE